MDPESPKLRSRLEAVPIRRSGDLYIALRDLEGLNPDVLALTPQAYFIITLLDGTNSIVDIQAAYMRNFGDILYSENIDGLIEKLDLHLFLENDRSRTRRQELVDEFSSQPLRPAIHAGVSYESDPERLSAQLQSYFARENGGPGDPKPGNSGKTLRGVVAPHIDLRAGGPCFAHTYKAVLEANPISTCVILGTGHEPLPHFFALSRKDFETPLGPLSTDNDFIDELISRCKRLS